MGYYENRKKAFNLIDQLLLESKSEKEIEYIISTKFGFGKGLIEQRIEMICAMKKIKDKKNEL